LKPGELKIYLGYAAGVGKTYQMLADAQDLKRQGIDVVIGYFEPHARKDTIAKTAGLEMIPRRVMQYRGTAFEEMDTAAILARKPEVCLVDEFPHTNVPGSERTKRWEDVQVMLDAGINVITTMNVQHLESLNDQVWQLTGVHVRETIPDWVMNQAAEVIMVDVTPRALLNRLERGAVYSSDKAKKAMENFFREQTLRALRELALRQTAHEVHRASDDPREKVLIHVTSDPAAAAIIRRGKRVADYLQGECFAVFVAPDGDLSHLPEAQRELVEKHLNFARNLHLETRLISGTDIAASLVSFARLHGITQIFLGWPHRKSFMPSIGRNLVQQVVRLARDMEVTVVADRGNRSTSPTSASLLRGPGQ
jgi:two-component system, OmpR family, sensor histidine kinase KdpD